MKRRYSLATASALLAMCALPAGAATINYTLGGVTFDDGGTASGTFSVNSVTGDITTFDITTTGGTTLGPEDYKLSDSLVGGDFAGVSNEAVFVKSDFSRYLNLVFVNPLTTGGLDSLVPGPFNFTNPAAVSYECTSCSEFRLVTAGSATGRFVATLDGVPEPATWAMMLVGFGGIGAAMRASRRAPVAA